MEYIKRTAIIWCLSISSIVSASNTLNELNYCLALIKLVDNKIVAAEEKYAAKDISQVHQGFIAYKEYIEVNLIRPGLLSFYRGDANKAKLLEQFYYRNQLNFMEHLDERYSEQKLIDAYAPAIQACAQESLPQDHTSYSKMVNALDTIKRMIKLGVS